MAVYNNTRGPWRKEKTPTGGFFSQGGKGSLPKRKNTGGFCILNIRGRKKTFIKSVRGEQSVFV